MNVNNTCSKGKRNLILLANSFPYGNWEAYLESEVKYYNDFDEVYICALQIRNSHKNRLREMPSEKFKIFSVFYAPKLVYLVNSVRAFADKNFYRELKKLVEQKKFSAAALVRLFVYFSRARYEAAKIKKYIKKSGLCNDGSKGVIYSYRFEYQPYVGALIQKILPNYTMIARAHRYDLYENENAQNYIPLREYLLEKLNKVVLISEHGYKYLSDAFPEYKSKMEVSKLGTFGHGLKNTKLFKPFKLVTCSSVVSVKRLDLLVKTLAEIKDTDIVWTHYGDGVLMENIKKLSADLPKNIHCVFKGNVNNEAVLKDYSEEDYHLFLNVSETEGIPVSIMEAMSFGIPCVATDVGGNGEIVTDGKSGFLIPKDFSLKQLADIIKSFADMPEEEYQKYRLAAHTDWNNNYNAEKNYPEFVNELYTLAEA